MECQLDTSSQRYSIYKTQAADKGILKKKKKAFKNIVTGTVKISDRVENKIEELSQKEQNAKMMENRRRKSKTKNLEDQCRKPKIHLSGVSERTNQTEEKAEGNESTGSKGPMSTSPTNKKDSHHGTSGQCERK